MSAVANRAFTLIFITLASGALFESCAHQTPALITLNEQLQQDRPLGDEMATHLDREVRFKNDPFIQKFLVEVAERLVDRIEVLRSAPVRVNLIEDQRKQWRNYGLPGTRLYLSAGLLRQMEFENEIAAALAFELSNITNRHAVERLTHLSNTHPGPIIDYTGPKGLFAFPEKSFLKSVDDAVEILYAAGYDPRGLLSLWERYIIQPKQSPFERATLNRLIENTRSALALYAPLRNPIVKSPSFFSIYKRLKRL